MRKVMMTGVLAVFMLGACVAEWNGLYDDTFESEWFFSDLICDQSGCYFCDDYLCEEYRCDATDQCPVGYVCAHDQRCLPGDDSFWGGTGACFTHRDCGPDELCTLEGECVASHMTPNEPSSAEPTTEPPTSNEPSNSADSTPSEPSDTTGAIPLPEHPEGVCVVNNDCGQNGICLDAGCYFPCDAAGACPGTQVCDENNQCMPALSNESMCTFNGECGPNRLCIEGACYATCEETVDCGVHEVCEAGLCEADLSPVIQCSGADSCGDTEGCFDGKCLDVCADGSGCGDGFKCEFGFCQQEVFCLVSDDCAAGTVCLDGSCR